MKTVKMKKRKNLIFIVSFIVTFIILITVAYNSYSATKEYFLGDTNLDNQITLSDELLLLRHIYSLKSDENNNWRLTGDTLVNADINEDKKIDMSDVLYIKRYLLAQKDTNIAEKHTEWTKLCKKITKEEDDIIKSYTLAIKPGEQTYTRETKTTMTVTAPETSYTVSFDGNGGSTPNSEKSIKSFSNWTLSGAGKVEDKKASPTTYTFGEGDATLTANYNKEGNSIVLPNSKRENYAVEGWYDSEELKNKVGNVGDSYSPTQDIILYAKWVNQTIEPTSVSLDKTSLSLDKDSSTYQLTAVIEPATSSIHTGLTWKSSNSNVATVSKDGLVTGKATGTAKITVETENGKTAFCDVDVKIDQTEPVEPIQITLNKNSTTIDLSTTGTEKLVATTNSTGKLTWKSSNQNVATVSDDGLVTGKANGETTITVSAETGETATCEVTVQTSATGITLDKTEQTLDMSSNKTFMLTPTVTPPTSNVNREIQINSSNPSVATIATNGTVTALSNGSTIITFRLKNGKEAKCNVTVQTSPTSVSLNKTSISLDSNSSTQQLVATINPATSNIHTGLTWKSSNSNVATVSDGGLVTGKATGTTKITVETGNGKTATCDVDVKMDSTELSNLKLNKEAITIDLSESNTEQLIATTNAPGGLNWSSDDEDVATVSRDGLVTGKSNGHAIITVIDSSGEIVTCDVTVQTSPTDVTLSVTNQTLDLSGTKTFTIVANVEPSTANVNNKIYLESNNPSVATVSENGLVTGIVNGTTEIVARTSNGKEARCDVKVQTSPTGIVLNVAEQTLDLNGTKTFKIVADILPLTANVNTTLYAKSSNPSVATVSESGAVTGIANGEATITIETENGKSANCNVVVQTSPTGIYFAENKDDETKYLSVKKGESMTAKAVLEPSTANVNTDITYTISSGNSKVASIDSNTGEITGKQAGVVTIQAKTASGKTTTIKLNVKIGNKVFDTTKLSDTSYTTSSLLYSKQVDIGAGFSTPIASHMQSFDIDSTGKIYYGSNGDGTRKDSYITYASKNKVSSDYMKITYFGHQAAIDMEESGSNRYIWVDALSSVHGTYGYTANYIVSRMKYIKGTDYNFAMGTVKVKDTSGKLLKTYKNTEGQNFVYITVNNNMTKGMHAAVDEDNRLLAIYYSKRIFVYDLDEALAIPDTTYEQEVETDDGNRIVEFQAKNLHTISKLTTITIQSGTNLDTDILSYAMQGFDLDGDYIYVAEGYAYSSEGVTKTESKTYITAFDYMYDNKGYKTAKPRKEAVAYNNTKSKDFLTSIGDTNKAEIEGIKVDTSGTNPIMYLGLMTSYKSKSANILKYTY